MAYYEQILKADPAYNEARQIEKNVRSLVSGKLPPALEELRKLIFDTWWTLNDELERVLSKHLFVTSHKLYWKDKRRERKYKEFADVAQSIFERLSFNDRVNLAKDYGLIERQLATKLTRLSKIRNEFSHPKLEKLQKYLDPQVRDSVLATLQSCLIEISGANYRFGL